MAKPGAFPPGVSGNPGGRPKVAKDVRMRAQFMAMEALNVIIKVMQDEEAPPASRASAAEKVLRVAGVPLSEDKAPEDRPGAPLTSQASADELEAAATQGEG